MRGHGRSGVPDDPSAYSVAASLGDMATLLAEAGADRAVLLGHSLGGYLSLEYTLAHPDQVAGLVLVDTGPGFRSDRGRAEWNAMTDRYAADLEERGLDGLPGSEELRGSVHRSAVGLAHTARATLRQEDGHVMASLPTITAPTLVVVGSRDQPFLAGSEYMAAKLPDARLSSSRAAGTRQRSPIRTSSTPRSSTSSAGWAPGLTGRASAHRAALVDGCRSVAALERSAQDCWPQRGSRTMSTYDTTTSASRSARAWPGRTRSPRSVPTGSPSRAGS